MLFGYLVDLFCEILLVGLAAGVVGFFVSVVVVLIGEKMKWW